MKSNVNELMTNQTHILQAIKYLNERVEDIIEKTKNSDEVKNIIESQSMIDEIIVKNTDDIAKIKKTKEENAVAIQCLETRIEKIDKEIETTKKTIQEKVDIVRQFNGLQDLWNKFQEKH